MNIPQKKHHRPSLKSHLRNKHLADSFRYAAEGIWTAFLHERVFTVELFAAILVAIAGFVFRVSRIEGAVLTICITLVLSAECLNSALERMVDLVTPEYHPLAKQIKDLAAGAVLITAIGSVIIGLQIFGPILLNWIGLS
jgi:diacylglycerol kinase